MSQTPRPRPVRRSTIETLETREVMSADPLGGLLGGAVSHHSVLDTPLEQHAAAPPMAHHGQRTPDFWMDEAPTYSLEEQLQQIERNLASAHGATGMDQVRESFGFDGRGQTVAVIDSGIAYDHFALGGGLGSNYRVVGGWDFAENDADPYDDGPAGYHGTHVAGIVGADAGTKSGVAPGVDLVGLRVFDDAGAGYFSWVENALKWVHNNRNSFENPITAVNLSLGTSWNSDSIPIWAMLEDEFAQLKADGIFISVSAGNSYANYGEPGLSYPAASPHVVPVMSSDDSGSLSYFSQRLPRAIAAPGRSINSTMPDHSGNHNGVDDDWANASGTSMAAPYVAGGSAIIREAMEFVGYTNITQDTIYDHMVQTADSFYDSSSDAYYNRLNMWSAIDALMPEDDFGSSELDAYSLGVIHAGPQGQAAPMSGHIASLNDADYFTFTAGATGTVTFSASNTTHRMNADWQWMGGEGWLSQDGLSCTMNVVAGQQYTVALSSGDGMGYYDLSYAAEGQSFVYTDWGQLGLQQTYADLTVAGEGYYRVVAGQAGYVTAQASQAGVTVDLLNAGLQSIATGQDARVDYYAQQGEELYLRVTGSLADLDIKLTNAVSLDGGVVTVAGGAGADVFSFSAGAWHDLSYNGTDYSFNAATVSQFNFYGNGGADAIEITGSQADEDLRSYEGRIDFNSDSFYVDAWSVEETRVNGGGGADRAFMYDSAGDDEYSTFESHVVMDGHGYVNRAYGFQRTFAYASGGMDRAFMNDTAGDDVYYTYSDRVVMSGENYYNNARGFERTFGYGSTGVDTLRMYDSAGDDHYRAYSDRVVMEGAGYYNNATNFSRTFAYASGGNDTARLYDTAGDDLYRAYDNYVVMSGDGYYNNARDFERTYAYASTGNDEARLYDSAGSDLFRGYADYSVMSGDGYYNNARGFGKVAAYSSGGADEAMLYDSAGADALFARDWGARLTGADFEIEAHDFARVVATASKGGADTADVDVTDYVFGQIGAWA